MNSSAVSVSDQEGRTSARVFRFQQQHDVRAVTIDGEPWFAATDVCAALAITNTARALSRLDDDEKGIHSMNTLGGAQDLSTINESGLYSLILTSRKAEAKAFKKWVTSEVLPSIRKTGAYIHAPAMRPALTDEQWKQAHHAMHMCTSAWCFGDESKGWLYNHMRVVFQVARIEDIPADQYEVLMQLIRSKEAASRDFLDFLAQAREWFSKEVLGGGQPWTPAIKAKLTRQLKRQVILPPKVDWLALAAQVESKAEQRPA